MDLRDLKWNSDNKKIFLIMIFGFIILAPLAFLYIGELEKRKMSNLTKIVREKNIKLKVKEARNDRGIYILNNRYYLNSGTKVVGEHYGLAIDHTIYRPENSQYIPVIWDISAPFELEKDADNDTLKLTKRNKTILLILENN